MAFKLNGVELSNEGRCTFNGSEVNKIIYNGVEVWKRCYELIPTMTSDTTPEGTVLCGSYFGSGTEGYRAFDGDNATNWCSKAKSASAVTEDYLYYRFDSDKTVHIDHIGFIGIGTDATFQNAYDVTLYIDLYNSSGTYVKQLEYSWSAEDKFNEVEIPCDASGVYAIRLSFSGRIKDGAETSSRYLTCAKLQAYGYEE